MAHEEQLSPSYLETTYFSYRLSKEVESQVHQSYIFGKVTSHSLIPEVKESYYLQFNGERYPLDPECAKCQINFQYLWKNQMIQIGQGYPMHYPQNAPPYNLATHPYYASHNQQSAEPNVGRTMPEANQSNSNQMNREPSKETGEKDVEVKVEEEEEEDKKDLPKQRLLRSKTAERRAAAKAIVTGERRSQRLANKAKVKYNE